MFPKRRLRRLRTTPAMRSIVQQTTLLPSDLICPIFVQEDLKHRVGIESMPGIERIPLDEVSREVESVVDLGVSSVMIFGIPKHKDDDGSSAIADDGIVQKTISQIRSNFGDNVLIMADVCLCQYMRSGHCGILKDNKVDNDSSLKLLAKIAQSQAVAGVDTVSPSAMMDGQVHAIREQLDDSGFQDVSIMSHSAKHRSNFYTPFRDAAECAPKFGDRKTYQVSYTNPRESMMEIASDIDEGADIVMIKPALAYLDLIHETRRRFDVPVSAYSVSGEYSLVKAAGQLGFVDEVSIMHEMLSSIKRAGADMIVTYFAKSMAKMMSHEKRSTV